MQRERNQEKMAPGPSLKFVVVLWGSAQNLRPPLQPGLSFPSLSHPLLTSAPRPLLHFHLPITAGLLPRPQVRRPAVGLRTTTPPPSSIRPVFPFPALLLTPFTCHPTPTPTSLHHHRPPPAPPSSSSSYCEAPRPPPRLPTPHPPHPFVSALQPFSCPSSPASLLSTPCLASCTQLP